MSTNCRDFESRLDLYAGGMLQHAERESIEEHLRLCPRCRSLSEAVRGGADGRTMEPPPDLAMSILSRTSGLACPGVQQQLCDRADDTLGRMERELVDLHLAHCPDCGRLAAALLGLKKDLPGLACLDPGPRFTSDVLGIVAALPPASPQIRLPFLSAEWWRRLMGRPRFALEAAYVGTLIFLILLGNPAILTRALRAQELLTAQGDSLLQESALVLAVQGEAAQQSLEKVQRNGRVLISRAANFQRRTVSAVHQRAKSALGEIKSILTQLDAATAPTNETK